MFNSIHGRKLKRFGSLVIDPREIVCVSACAVPQPTVVLTDGSRLAVDSAVAKELINYFQDKGVDADGIA